MDLSKLCYAMLRLRVAGMFPHCGQFSHASWGGGRRGERRRAHVGNILNGTNVVDHPATECRESTQRKASQTGKYIHR